METARSRKWIAHSPLCRGRQVKAVSESLGVARSQLTARLKQPAPGTQLRRGRKLSDAVLVEQIKQTVGALPSYGHRRVLGLLRR